MNDNGESSGSDADLDDEIGKQIIQMYMAKAGVTEEEAKLSIARAAARAFDIQRAPEDDAEQAESIEGRIITAQECEEPPVVQNVWTDQDIKDGEEAERLRLQRVTQRNEDDLRLVEERRRTERPSLFERLSAATIW